MPCHKITCRDDGIAGDGCECIGMPHPCAADITGPVIFWLLACVLLAIVAAYLVGVSSGKKDERALMVKNCKKGELFSIGSRPGFYYCYSIDGIEAPYNGK